jgi:ATP-dependent helicase HrpA
MTEQKKLTLSDLHQQLDSLMLRDRLRFARRLQGQRKLKILKHSRAFFRRWLRR